MDAETLKIFGRQYRNYLRCLAPLARYCPEWIWPLVQKTLGRALSPYRFKKEAICAGIAEVFGAERSKVIWSDWQDSHSSFVRGFTRYHLLTPQDIQRQVYILDTDVLAQLREEGGLVFTYHTHHQNIMCCALGFAGCKVFPIAGAPEVSPIFPYVSQWALQINRESAKHFRGGEYLFVNNLRYVARSIRKVLKDKDVVVCLSDFHQPDSSGWSLPFLSRRISPPAGVMDVAIRLQVPVYIALCAPENGQLVLRLQRYGIVKSRDELVRAYIAFLEQACRQNPVCWQGWDWFNDLPRST